MAKKKTMTPKEKREAWESIRDSAKELAELATGTKSELIAERLANIADAEARRIAREEGGQVEV